MGNLGKRFMDAGRIAAKKWAKGVWLGAPQRCVICFNFWMVHQIISGYNNPFVKGPICHQNIFGNHHNEFRCTLVWDLGKHNIFQFWKHILPWQKAFSFHVVSEVINSTLPWQKAQILFPKKIRNILDWEKMSKISKKWKLMKSDEIWWKPMFSSDFIRFHQISSVFIFWYFLKYFWNIFLNI